MKKERQKFILEGELFKVILTLSLPLMFNNFIQTVYNVTDVYFVSKLGGSQLAGITLIWPVIFLLISLNMGIDMAGGAIISQQYGAGNHEKTKELAGQLVFFAIIYSLIIGSIGFVMCERLIILMGGRGELLEAARGYLKLICLGTPFMSYTMAYAHIKQGLGDTVSPMRLNIISVGINVVLDPIMIFTLGMGVKGAAVATIIARFIGAMIAFYYLHCKEGENRIDLSYLKPRKELLMEIFNRGIPLSVGMSMTSIGFIILNSFVVKYGESTMAAFGIGNRIVGLLLMPIMGIGGAMAIVVGQNLGGGKNDRIIECFKKAVIIVGAICIPFVYLLRSYAENIVGVFVKEGDIFRMGTEYLKITSLTIVCLGVFQIVTGIFQGISQSKKAMFLGMSRLWLLRIPMIMFISFYFNLGEYTIWYSMFASNLISSVIAVLMFLKTDVRNLSMVKVS